MNDLSPLPHKPTLAQIMRLQEFMLAQDEQLDLPTKHYFAEGMYGRELFVPADAIVVGKMHRHEHLIMLMQGDTTIWTDQGMQRITAPMVWVSSAGTKRVFRTHSDCVFLTVHLNPSNTTDEAELEASIIVPNHEIEFDASSAIEELQGELS